MNLELLKNKIFEKRKTYGECSKVINVSHTSFSNKMNPDEEGKPEFKVSEINKLSNFLDLNSEEKINIFFGN